MIHRLKSWPPYFAALVDGTKTFELRRRDRSFEVGDSLILLEYDPEQGTYSGRKVIATVRYIHDGGTFGVAPDYCVLGLKVTFAPTYFDEEANRGRA